MNKLTSKIEMFLKIDEPFDYTQRIIQKFYEGKIKVFKIGGDIKNTILKFYVVLERDKDYLQI